MSTLPEWRPTRSGLFLHIDSGYGNAVCGVGRLVAERIAGRTYEECLRCLTWKDARG